MPFSIGNCSITLLLKLKVTWKSFIFPLSHTSTHLNLYVRVCTVLYEYSYFIRIQIVSTSASSSSTALAARSRAATVTLWAAGSVRIAGKCSPVVWSVLWRARTRLDSSARLTGSSGLSTGLLARGGCVRVITCYYWAFVRVSNCVASRSSDTLCVTPRNAAVLLVIVSHSIFTTSTHTHTHSWFLHR